MVYTVLLTEQKVNSSGSLLGERYASRLTLKNPETGTEQLVDVHCKIGNFENIAYEVEQTQFLAGETEPRYKITFDQPVKCGISKYTVLEVIAPSDGGSQMIYGRYE